MSEWNIGSPYYSPSSRPHDDCLQWSNMTREERFPKIFSTLKELKPDAKRIMSFGCSTGEECFALAAAFPDAEVVGVDISTYSIERARQQNKDRYPGRVFFHSSPEHTGEYDIVTSLMVLFSMWQPVKLKDWVETVEKIDTHVKEDGVWAVYTSQFPFAKAEKVGPKYHVVREWTRKHPQDKKEYHCGYYRKAKAEVEDRTPFFYRGY